MNYYELFGVEPLCDFRMIKKAYFRKAKQCHPDRFNNARSKEEEFKLVVAAFDVLSDPEKRLIYDRSIGIVEDESRTVRSAFIDLVAKDSIMDTKADDILEELIVGNNPPPTATLATLFLDLERTRVFMTFREGKNLFFAKSYSKSEKLFKNAVALSPHNILYRCFLARNLALTRKYSQAYQHYRAAINMGTNRIPPQRMERIRHELEQVNKKRLPWWSALSSWFAKNDGDLFVRGADQQMIDETNRSIAGILADKKKNKKMLNE